MSKLYLMTNLLPNIKISMDEEMIAFSKESIGSRKILHISEEHAGKLQTNICVVS